jgi:hypothetical protein
MGDRLRELLENLRDPYWRLDHKEELTLIVLMIAGAIQVVYRIIEALILRRINVRSD